MTAIIISIIVLIILVKYTCKVFAQDYAEKQASIIADNARSDALDDVLFKVAQLKNPQNLIEYKGK